ncbi:MAG: ATP-dependent helicase [Aureispira sp.]
MTNIRLSTKQQEIVNLNAGAYLVMASAGSGKTRVLTERIKRLLPITKRKILTITFTNKAGEELRERLEQVQAVKDKVFIGTFHSFCQSILELRFKMLGYRAMPHIFEDDSDRIELIGQAIEQVPYFKDIYSEIEPSKRLSYKYEVLKFIADVKRELIAPEELIEHSEEQEFLLLYKAYEDILNSNNAIDFDDIIRLVYHLFSNNEGVLNLYKKTYEYICVDEAQDLNKAQYYLLLLLINQEKSNIMMVGDPNQSIYAFNGSSSEFMQKDFVEEFNAEVYQLKENYRCAKSIIEASHKLTTSKIDTSIYKVPGLFKVAAFANEEEEAVYIVEKILELLKTEEHEDIETAITPDSFAVLARNKYIFSTLEKQLNKHKIPFFYKTGNIGLKYDSIQMKLFDYFFRIKINPQDKLHQDRIKAILKLDDISNRAMLEASKYPEIIYFFDFVQCMTVDNLNAELKKLTKIVENNASDHINKLSDDDKMILLRDVEEFRDNWVTYLKKNSNRSLTKFKNSLALGTTNQAVEQKGITLSTVHTMKGQESDIVFLMGMDEGTFPDYRAIEKGGVSLQQEKNNLYVAFTRARRLLYVTYPKSRIMPWGAKRKRAISRFLKPFLNVINQ